MSDLKEMENEITPETEWVCFNDNSIYSLKDNWLGLIEQMVEMACYPTILFYEKLDENDKYKVSAGFNLSDEDLLDLQAFAEKMNLEYSLNIEDMFSKEYIERQI